MSDKKEKPSTVAIIVGSLTSLFSMWLFLVGADILGASNIIIFGVGDVESFFEWFSILSTLLFNLYLMITLFGFFSGAMLVFKGGKTSKVFVGLFWILTIIIFGYVYASLIVNCC